MKTQLNMKLQMNYLEKDNWAHLLKSWHAITWPYKVYMYDNSMPK